MGSPFLRDQYIDYNRDPNTRKKMRLMLADNERLLKAAMDVQDTNAKALERIDLLLEESRDENHMLLLQSIKNELAHELECIRILTNIACDLKEALAMSKETREGLTKTLEGWKDLYYQEKGRA